MNDIDYDKLSSMVADKVSSQIAEKLIQKTTKLTLSRPCLLYTSNHPRTPASVDLGRGDKAKKKET